MNVVAQFPAARDYGGALLFRAMFEAAALGIAICRLDGRILEANPALAKMFGYSEHELVGARAGALNLEALPHEQETALLRGELESFEIRNSYRRKDGSELHALLTLSLGRDARREPSFLVAMLADASGRKREEELLREAEKMQVIGRLAGGIAHDFNNLLTGILLYCDLLSTGLGDGGFGSAELAAELMEGDSTKTDLAKSDLAKSAASSDALQRSGLRQHVDDVRMASEQGAALTRQLLTIARKQGVEARPILINEIVASTKSLLRRLLGEKIELVVMLDPALDAALDPTRDPALEPGAGGAAIEAARSSFAGCVRADPSQLRQILLNLVLNARDAMPDGGKIHLTTRAAEFPSVKFPGQGERPGEQPKGRRAIVLTVKDEGCGMDAGTRARLFELFFTTKKEGAGTGLGLATVQRIASELEGAIEVESEPGRGTSIAIFLPALG